MPDQVPLEIVRYNNTDWELTVVFANGKRYTYRDIPENWYSKVRTWLRHSNYSAAIKFLQRCAGREA